MSSHHTPEMLKTESDDPSIGTPRDDAQLTRRILWKADTRCATPPLPMNTPA
jgi:hypothetical protein